MIPDAFESLGFQLGLMIYTPIVALMIAVSLVALWRWLATDIEDWGMVALLVGALAAVAAIIWVVVAIPFNPAYWQDYRVEGEVLTVSNTWADDGGDMARVPVVTLDTVDRPLVIDDPRAVTLQGEQVTLTCSIGWHFRAADTYSCRIAQIGA